LDKPDFLKLLFCPSVALYGRHMSDKPILLAEDDSGDVFMFWRFHKMCGVHNRLEVFSDGEDIISYFKSSRANCPIPALIFLDWKMPKIGGLQVLEYITKSGYQDLPTVLLTGNEDPNLLGTAQQLGVTSFLTKPVEKRLFCELMARIEGIEMKGCPDVPTTGIVTAKSLRPTILPPMHREIFGRKDAWPAAGITVIGRDLFSRQSLERLLRAAGMEAHVFDSTRDFLASGQVEHTGCLLLHTTLPGMDCPELCEGLRRTNAAVPIIVITSPAAVGQPQNLSRNGIVACLATPVEWETLRQAISLALQRNGKSA